MAIFLMLLRKREILAGHKIYILEDDDSIRDVLQRILTTKGYTVSAFATIGAFTQQMRIALPDLCILDVMLPDGSGLDVSSKLNTHAFTSHVPVLVMSADFRNEHLYKQSGAWTFINKPFDMEDLLNSIKKLL